MESFNKNNYLIELGKHIAQLRLNKGISQAEFARCCGKDPQSLNRLEKGKVNPSIIYLLEIANELEMSVSDLINFKMT